LIKDNFMKYSSKNKLNRRVIRKLSKFFKTTMILFFTVIISKYSYDFSQNIPNINLVSGKNKIVENIPRSYIRVTDGDTIRIGDRRIRLYGIDAPEIKQICLKDNLEWKCGIEKQTITDYW
jgi:endonuclease YncB( thermonuclease family)